MKSWEFVPDRSALRVAAALAAALYSCGSVADIIATGPVQAADDNKTSLFVSDTEFYDSNLFKQPSSIGPIEIVGSSPGSRSDEYNVGTVGGDVQRVFGRQTFDVNLNVSENRFDHNSQLDNTSGGGHVLWDWEIGPYLSGQASATFTRALAGFAETLYLGKDLVDYTNYFATGRYQIGPRWALLAEVQSDYATHGAAAEYFNDFHDQTLSGGVEYATSPQDTFSLIYHHFEGRFPNAYIYQGVTFDRNYHEDFPQFYVKYAVSDKTLIDANVGRITRRYDGVGIGEYTGIIWRAGIDYLYSDKLDVTVRAYHEIHAYSENDSDYFVAKGYSVGPRWNVTDRLKFSFLVTTEKDSYLPGSTIFPGSTGLLMFASREDKQSFEQVTVNYIPREKWNVSLFFRHLERMSNQALVAFDDQFANISVAYRFF